MRLHRLISTATVLLAALLLSGCASVWVSNTYVAYVPPGAKPAEVILSGDKPDGMVAALVPFSPAPEDAEIKPKDCLAVDFAGGYSHDAFVPRHERWLARLLGKPVDAQLSLMVSATLHPPAAAALENTFHFQNVGQQEGRHLTGVTHDTIIQPFTFNNHDITLAVALSELDEEEYKKLVANTESIASQAREKLGEMAQAKGVNPAAPIPSSASALGTVFTFTATQTSTVLVGVEAMKASAKLMQALHGANDLLMQERIRLVGAGGLKGPSVPRLRYGTYLFVRSSVHQGPLRSPPCVRFDPVTRDLRALFAKSEKGCAKREEELARDKDWEDKSLLRPTWLAIVVRQAAPEMCAKKGD